MIVLRAVFLEVLLVIHVLGAAVLFRRFFPRESPWLGFFVPILTLLAGLNFLEHFVALPNLGWLLPVTTGGALWALGRGGKSWSGLVLPSVLFVLTFSFVFLLKCLSPNIPNYTEGVGNATRVLNYCLGGKLPPIDCFLPPLDYGGYYSFQQYGAAILKRLFFVDLGTAYNLSFAFLLAWMCLAGAAVAHAITGRAWIASVMILLLLAGMTGSAPFLLFSHAGLNFTFATNPNTAWNDPTNPLKWLGAHDTYHPELKLLPPIYTLYYSEYHANLGGIFITFLSVFAAMEIFRPARGTWCWILLIVLPAMIIITSAWFFFLVVFLCGVGAALALLSRRRPEQAGFALVAGGIGLILIWPSMLSILQNPATMDFHWARPDERTPLWMFALQWWPIYVPWFFLCFVWDRLDLRGRWIHLALVVMFVAVEFSVFGDRGLTIEKMWGAVFGIGLVTLVPYLCLQTGLFFRLLAGALILVHLVVLGGWIKSVYYDPIDRSYCFHIEGNYYMLRDPQLNRMLQALKPLHAATILPGKSYWAYNEAPGLVTFSENRCYVAYFHQEYQAGHGPEAEYRSSLNNEFYRGEMTDPLPLLRANRIAAVLIWPEDEISDELLQKLQSQIGSEYFYINCKADGARNAGVFMRQAGAPVISYSKPPAPLDLGPLPPAQPDDANSK